MNDMNSLDIQGQTFLLRSLTLDDLAACCELETAAHSHPWSKAQVLSALQRYSCWGLDCDGQLIAFAVVSCIQEEAELLDFVVANSHRGRGFGTALLEWLQHWLRMGSEARRFFLEVRESNVAALALYSRAGFVEAGVRRGYYPARSGRENAILMAMELL